MQPEPKKREACNPKQDGEPGKATRSSVYQEEKVSGNTWPTSIHELQKETHSSANYFPGFCCFPLKKLSSSWTLSSRKMQIATEWVIEKIEKTWHEFKNSGSLSKRYCKARQTLSFRSFSSPIPHGCISYAASTQLLQNLWGWKGPSWDLVQLFPIPTSNPFPHPFWVGQELSVTSPACHRALQPKPPERTQSYSNPGRVEMLAIGFIFFLPKTLLGQQKNPPTLFHLGRPKLKVEGTCHRII